MATTVTKNKKGKKTSGANNKAKGATVARKAPTAPQGVVGAIDVAPATVRQANGAHENVYKDAVAEIKALSENDSYARKIDQGPLNEARGKDTWRLHAQLRASDQLNNNLHRHVTGIRGQLQEIDEHLNADATAIVTLVGDRSDDLVKRVQDSRSSLDKSIASLGTDLGDAVFKARKSVLESVTETGSDLGGRLDGLQKTVTASFDKLAKATAGTEENLRSQTDAFSKAVEGLLGDVQHTIEKRIGEFRDESTRQVDKRFNQADVAFAALRADLEVVKALLTDIIKDRLGRPEARRD